MSTISVPAPGLKTSVSGEMAVRELETQLHDTQQSVVRQRVAAGLLTLGTGAMLTLAAVAAVDYYFEVGFALRAAWLSCVLIAAGAAGLSGWKRYIAPYTLTRAAVDAEGHVAGFGQRLRTMLDYDQQSPPPARADQRLLAALQRDTYEVAQKTNWQDVVDVRPTFLAFSAAALTASVLCIALISSGEYRVALARAVLLPVDYTTVTFTPQTQIVRIGESAEIRASVAGRPIETAVVRYRAAGSQDEWMTIDLSPVADEEENQGVNLDRARPPLPPLTKGGNKLLLGDLTAKLEDLQHDLEFEVVAGPRALPWGMIQVLQPLTLEESQSRIIPPAYTSKPEETIKGLELKVLEGSTIELALNLNRAAAEAKATIVDSSSDAGELPLLISGNSVRGTLTDLRKSASWTITAKAADGMVLEPARLSIRVQLDRKPEIKFIEPPEELVVTATTEVPMSIEAGDDIGLHKVGILFQINDGDVQVLCEQEAAGLTEPFLLSQTLLLEEHQLSHKDSLTYYAFAEDRYFDEVRRTTTPLRFIDIRPFQTSFQLVEGDGECKACNGASVTLEELIVRQRKNLSEAFAAQDQNPVDGETADRLHESQAELLEKTREFEQGIAQLAGPIPTLASAVLNMQAAVDALLTKQVTRAVGAEKQALADLIRARENVRKKLSQSNSQSASACRKFDREQRQKLRLPEKKKGQDKQQQVAGLRKKLDDLAKQERKWSQECSQCNNPSSSGKPGQSSQSQSSKSQSQKNSTSQQSEQASSASAKKEGPQEQQTGQKHAEQPSETRSPAELAQEQQKMRAELDKLRERLEKLTAAGAAAREQARQADESMQQGLQDLDKQDVAAAAKEGERSAEQLERLADHLAAMNAGDFGQRLDQAQKLARKLADQQQALDKSQQSSQQSGSAKSGNEKSGSGKSDAREAARKERELAGEGDLLADQLEALARDASREKGGVQGKLRSVQAENPPREITGLMREAAGDLESNRQEQAGRGMAQAGRRLDELSRSLADIHGEFSQPELEELMALEQQLANLMEQTKRAPTGREKVAATQQKWSELGDRLEGPAKSDKRLAQALHRLREGVTPEGHYTWLELADFNGPREVAKVLQMKIQEAILAGALQDADQPIPTAYKALVEKYYRALSDDLR